MSEQQEELPESMREDPLGGCRALLWLAIGAIVVAGVILKVFVWR